MATPTADKFGLVNSSILDLVRSEQRRADKRELFKDKSGASATGAGIGYALGSLLSAGAAKAGWTKDKESKLAQEITDSEARAVSSYDALPDGEKKTDVYEAAIQQRLILSNDLRANGNVEQADTVNEQIMALQATQQKFQKQQGEIAAKDIETENARLELEKNKKGLKERFEVQNNLNLLRTLDPSDPKQALEMDVITARNELLTTITGSTENDPAVFDKILIRDLEKATITATDVLDGFLLSDAQFNPEYLTLEGKLTNWAYDMVDIAGFALPEDAKRELQAYTQFRQVTGGNVNAYIKEVTGAQMSIPERAELKKDVPNNEDGPAAFAAKMELTLNRMRAAQARSLSALAHADDRKEFTRIRNTPLTDWMETAEQQKDSADAKHAREVLNRYKVQLEQEANAPQ